MKRIILNEKDFAKLVSGEIITKDDVQIALSDIGYVLMLYSIYKSMER